MKFDVLLAFIRKGQVTARSIVRGPTTHQFWRYAAHVKGLSREFGLCYSCGFDISTESHLCPHCGKIQEPPAQPDLLLEAAATPGGAARTNGSTAIAASESQNVPDMVDAEVVLDEPRAAAPVREATRVVIEPIIEVTPQLAEPEDEPDAAAAATKTSYEVNGHPNGNGAASNGSSSVVEDRGTNGASYVSTAGPATMNGNGVAHSNGSASTALMSPSDIEAAFHMRFTPVAEFLTEQRSTRRFPWFALALLLLIAGLVVAAMQFPAERQIAWDWTVQHFAIAKDWVMAQYAQYRK
jgi:hypothetical protein